MPIITVNAKTTLDSALDSEKINAFYTGLAEAAKANLESFVDEKSLGYNCYYFTQHDSLNYNGMQFNVSQNFLCQRISMNAYRCHFVGSKIGYGSFAQVYQVEAVVDVTPTSYIPHGGYRQVKVIKQQDHCDCTYQSGSVCDLHNSIDMLKHEYNASVKVPYLRVEQPQMVRKSGVTSYTVMAQIPGTDLFQILEQDHEKTSILSLEQRMDLSLELYRALKQVSDLRLVHRDLKPENILVTMAKPIKAQIVDYGFAIILPEGQQKIKVYDFCGTSAYVSPEMLEQSKSISFATDLYSLTRVLLVLWGGIDVTFAGKLSNHMFFMNKVNKLNNLFKNLPRNQVEALFKLDLDQDIRLLFEQGLAKNQLLRGTVEEAIDKFKAIDLKYKIATKGGTLFRSASPHAAAGEAEEYNSAAKACAALGGPQTVRVASAQSHHSVYQDSLPPRPPALEDVPQAENDHDTFQCEGIQCTIL